MSSVAHPGSVALTGWSKPSEADRATHTLVLPGIHCAGCMAGVERVLRSAPGVENASVNLSQKRAMIAAPPGADPTPWIEALAGAGYEAYEARDPSPSKEPSLLLHLGVAGFAMMNVMLLSVAVWSGAADTTRDLLHLIAALIAIPATAFAAQPFFRKAFTALSAGRLDMDVPISLAIILALGISVYETAQSGAHTYYDAALSLTFFLLAGRVLDQRMRRAVRSAASDLSALEPSRTVRVEGDARVSRPVDEIDVGDRLWLAAGSRVPVDGILDEREARVDRSALTGEIDPVHISEGGELLAGDVMLTGPVQVRATMVGESTTLRRIARLISVAETARGRYSSLAEKAAAIYTPAVHLIALLTFVAWISFSGDLRLSLNVAIATLIITCPCALGLAIPAVSAAATGRLYRKGCLVKSDTALERLATVDTVVLDKTGTLTRPELVLPGELPNTAKEVLRGLSEASDHPLTTGLRVPLSDVHPAGFEEISEHPGKGVSARHQGQNISLLASEDGRSAVLTIGPDTYRLDRVEQTMPGAEALTARLKRDGYDLFLLTGDSKERAESIAMELGISNVLANTRADRKVEVIEALKSEGRNVLMVGDGLNDAAALTAATVSIAPGHALDISRNAADVVLTGKIDLVAEALTSSALARRLMIQNLLIAAGYNSIAIPLAVLGFASPLMAAIAMSTSSITVTLNALRVR